MPSSNSVGLRSKLAVETLEDRRLLAVLTVGNNSDLVNGDISSIDALIADDGGDGVSLREAIKASNASPGADEINFDFGHDGPETIVLGGAELQITDDLTIAGPGADLLKIDANGESRVFRIGFAEQDRAPDALISGLLVTGGQSPSSDADPDFYLGGGVINYGRTTLADCRVIGNSADTSGGGVFNANVLAILRGEISENSVNRSGGAVASRSGVVTLEGVLLKHNSANFGGAIDNDNQSDMSISESTITENHADFDGGGIRNYRRGVLQISASQISDNFAASNGGGIWNYHDLSIHDSDVSGNEAGEDGGGIWNYDKLDVDGSQVSGNKAERHGGGVYNHAAQGEARFSNTTFDGNAAGYIGGGIYNAHVANLKGVEILENSAERGGGVFSGYALSIESSILKQNAANSGGAIYNTWRSEVASSLLYDNNAEEDGGAVRTSGSRFTLKDSTVSSNSAGRMGGGLYSDAEIALQNSTVYSNSAEGTGGGLFNNGSLQLWNSIVAGSPLGGDVQGVGSVAFAGEHNLVQDGSLIGPGILNVDPMLAPLADNGGPTETHALTEGSPAIDAGGQSVATDLDGKPLPWDQRGEGFRRILGYGVDLGAYESVGFLPGDATDDGSVDLDDFNFVKDHFGETSEGYLGGDFNGDGLVDLIDFNILKANFGEQAAAQQAAISAVAIDAALGEGDDE